MSISSKFNFDNLWSEKSTDADRLLTQHAKYDFAVAYLHLKQFQCMV